jgi:hypothetical protein
VRLSGFFVPALVFSGNRQNKSGARGAAKNPVWQEEERLGNKPLPGNLQGKSTRSEYRSLSGLRQRHIHQPEVVTLNYGRNVSFFRKFVAIAPDLLNGPESRTIPGIVE